MCKKSSKLAFIATALSYRIAESYEIWELLTKGRRQMHLVLILNSISDESVGIIGGNPSSKARFTIELKSEIIETVG
jgi:hypothetical protein